MGQPSTDLNYQFLKQLADLDFVENIYLFGSRARGDNDPKSDIDLAVNCPTATDNDWQHVLDIIENADTLLQIDCVRLDNLSNKKLETAIMTERKLIYSKD